MKNSPGSEERRGITCADVQPAQGERLECRSARSIDPLEGRKCQVITRLDGKLHRSRGKGTLPSKGICKCFDSRPSEFSRNRFDSVSSRRCVASSRPAKARWLWPC